MAELLIRVAHRKDGAREGRTEPGDVIVIRPDGWRWGERELDNPEWRIFHLPGVDPASLGALLEQDQDAERKTVRPRVRGVNVDHPTIRAAIQRGQVVELTAQERTAFTTAVRDKPARVQLGR